MSVCLYERRYELPITEMAHLTSGMQFVSVTTRYDVISLSSKDDY